MDENTIGGNGSGIAGGTAKSEGERDGKSGKSGRTDFKSEIGNKGFVEPALARTTAGNANIAADTAADTGSTGDTPGYVPPEQPTVKRGRGRPRKDGSTAAPKEARNLNVNGIEKILFSIHLIAAKGLDVPELLLDDKEAKVLAEAIRKVSALRGHADTQTGGHARTDFGRRIDLHAARYRILFAQIRRSKTGSQHQTD